MKRVRMLVSRSGFPDRTLWNTRSSAPSAFTTLYLRIAFPAFLNPELFEFVDPFDNAAVHSDGCVGSFALRGPPITTTKPLVDSDRVRSDIVPAQTRQFADPQPRIDRHVYHRRHISRADYFKLWGLEYYSDGSPSRVYDVERRSIIKESFCTESTYWNAKMYSTKKKSPSG